MRSIASRSCGLNTPTVPVVDDGKDALFGDVGNDWLVGGTNENHLWGGYGDDLLNGNDNHDSTLGTADPLANNTTNGRDIGPTFVDFVFGGAGRDVLYADTYSDRLLINGDVDYGDQNTGSRDPQNLKGAGTPDKNSIQFGIAANAPSATIPVTVQGMTFGPTSQPAITPASSRG